MPGPWEAYRAASAAGPTTKEADIIAGTKQSEATTAKTLEDAETERQIREFKVREAAAVAALKEREAAKGPALTEDERKAKLQGGNLDALVKQVNRVQSLFNSGQKDNAIPLLGSLVEYLPLQENKQFDAAAAGLAEQGLAAFRVPGVGAQSDTELRQFTTANKPSSWSMDSENLERLRQLRSRVDSTRAELGLPPAEWEGLPDDEGFERDTSPEAIAAAKAAGGDAGPLPPGADGGNIVPPGAGGPQFSPGDPSMQAATGDSRRIADPELQAEIDSLLRQGASFQDINTFAMSRGAEPINRQQYLAVRNFLRKNPDYEGSLVEANRYEPVTAFEKGVTKLGSNPVGAYFLGAGQMLSGNTMDDLAPDPERANMALAMGRAQSPTATGIGQISGATLAALTAEAGLARMGMAPGLARGALADVGMGAASGAGAADDGGRAMGALQGAGYAGLGSAGGNMLGAGLRRIGTGVADPSVRALAAEGNPLTVGQVYGRSGRIGEAIKGVEDRLSGIPVLGSMVNARRREGVEALNSRAFDRALQPIGGSVQGQIGENAVETAQQQVSNAYQQALGGAVVQADQQFARELPRAVNRVANLARVGPEVAEEVRDILAPYMNGTAVTGEAMQAMVRDLQQLRRSYRNDTRAHAVGRAVDGIENAILGMFQRQAPDVVPAYQRANLAYRRLSTLEDAVLKGKNTEGVFSPAQLGQADRTSTIRYGGKRAAARGDGQFHGMQRDAQNVLPSAVPDSGTAGRLALGAGILGAGAGADALGAGGSGLTLAAILTGAYTRAGQRLLTKPGRGVNNPQIRDLLTDERVRQLLGKAGAGTGAALGLGTYPGP